MQVKKQQLELDTEPQNGSKSRKEYIKAIYCHTDCLTFLQVKYVKCQAGGSTSWNQDGGRNINNLRYADDTTLMAESEEELKSLLMNEKEEIKKVGLKLSIQKTNIMASGPITSWQINVETLEAVTDFIFLGSKICSLEEKLCQL